jgi:hypothetical protein
MPMSRSRTWPLLTMVVVRGAGGGGREAPGAVKSSAACPAGE